MEGLQEFLSRHIVILKSHYWIPSQMKGSMYVRELVMAVSFSNRERNKLYLYQQKNGHKK